MIRIHDILVEHQNISFLTVIKFLPVAQVRAQTTETDIERIQFNWMFVSCVRLSSILYLSIYSSHTFPRVYKGEIRDLLHVILCVPSLSDRLFFALRCAC